MGFEGDKRVDFVGTRPAYIGSYSQAESDGGIMSTGEDRAEKRYCGRCKDWWDLVLFPFLPGITMCVVCYASCHKDIDISTPDGFDRLAERASKSRANRKKRKMNERSSAVYNLAEAFASRARKLPPPTTNPKVQTAPCDGCGTETAFEDIISLRNVVGETEGYCQSCFDELPQETKALRWI